MSTAAIRRLAVPSPDELIARARAMVPEIRALAEETERNRNLFPHIVEKIRAAELLRTCRPAMFGGFEYDGEVALKIAMTISAGCASTGWTVNGAVSNGLSLAHWSIEAQREIWGDDTDPFTFACFAPTGTAVPVEGGYRLSGSWSFASGCDISAWGKLGAMIQQPDTTAGGRLLPAAGRGLRDHRQLVRLRPVRHRQQGHRCRGLVRPGAPGAEIRRHQGRRRARRAPSRQPDLPHPAVDARRVDAGLDRDRGREGRARRLSGDDLRADDARRAGRRRLRMKEFATVQLRLAEAASSVEAAELILLTDMRNAMASARGEEITVADRIRARRNQAYATKLAVQAVEALNASTGGYGLHLDNPVQRAWRDVNAVARHVSLNWDAVGTMYGQHAFGLEPKGQY